MSTQRECSLLDLRPGERGTVVAVDPAHVLRLAAHGIGPGVMVVVESDAPFRGPRIVQIGSARVALARDVTKAVSVAACGARELTK